MISKRLLSLVDYIEFNDKVIDVGCDHALLDIYLVKHDFLKNIIVSDVHKNALNSGIENIKKYNLQDKITARLGNGLEVLNDHDDINTLIISGMGTNTILNILNSQYTKNLNKLIIQSNNDHYNLRKEICNLGFKIFDESYVYDNDKYYVNIVFIRGEEIYSEFELKYGPILMKNGKEYYTHEKDKLLGILEGIPYSSESRKEIVNKIKELDDLINI